MDGSEMSPSTAERPPRHLLRAYLISSTASSTPHAVSLIIATSTLTTVSTNGVVTCGVFFFTSRKNESWIT